MEVSSSKVKNDQLKGEFMLSTDSSLPIYLSKKSKNSWIIERLSCIGALLVLVAVTFFVVYLIMRNVTTKEDQHFGDGIQEWNITREMWLARPYDDYKIISEHFQPMMLVVIHHTVSLECTTLAQCAAELRNIQGYYFDHFKSDIPYNFLIGNDDRVYEGRGWNIEGAHTLGYNLCSTGIGFIGDYRGERPVHSKVTELQLERLKMLLDEGVRLGYLRPDYKIVGAKDLQQTTSPGSNIMEALRKLDNYDHQNRFAGLNCSKIHEKYGDVPL